jgi:hypothetical protein
MWFVYRCQERVKWRPEEEVTVRLRCPNLSSIR